MRSRRNPSDSARRAGSPHARIAWFALACLLFGAPDGARAQDAEASEAPSAGGAESKEVDPRVATRWLREGGAENYERAWRALDRAAARSPEDADLQWNRALAAWRSGRPDHAEEAAEKAAALSDGRYTGLRDALLGNVRFERAREVASEDPAGALELAKSAAEYYGRAAGAEGVGRGNLRNLERALAFRRALEEQLQQQEGEPGDGEGEPGDGEQDPKDGEQGEGQEGQDQQGEGEQGEGQEGQDQQGEGQQGEGQEGQNQQGQGQQGEGQQGEGQEGQDQQGEGQQGDGQEGQDQQSQGQPGQSPSGQDREDPLRDAQQPPGSDDGGDRDLARPDRSAADDEQTEPPPGEPEQGGEQQPGADARGRDRSGDVEPPTQPRDGAPSSAEAEAGGEATPGRVRELTEAQRREILDELQRFREALEAYRARERQRRPNVEKDW
jgi:hypothetical protein